MRAIRLEHKINDDKTHKIIAVDECGNIIGAGLKAAPQDCAEYMDYTSLYIAFSKPPTSVIKDSTQIDPGVIYQLIPLVAVQIK
jgi:hypothetical protein